MSAATPETPRQRAGVADATALRGVAPGRVIPADPSGQTAGVAGTPCAFSATVAAFWWNIGRGAIRLHRHDDALIWRMRAQGAGWAEIAGQIVMNRLARRKQSGRKALVKQGAA